MLDNKTEITYYFCFLSFPCFCLFPFSSSSLLLLLLNFILLLIVFLLLKILILIYFFLHLLLLFLFPSLTPFAYKFSLSSTPLPAFFFLPLKIHPRGVLHFVHY